MPTDPPVRFQIADPHALSREAALAHIDHVAPDAPADTRAALVAVIDAHGAWVDPQHCADCAAAAAAAQSDAAEYTDERAAEDGWLRVAEAGTPDTWAEEDHARLVDALGYGPPAGYEAF